MLAQRAASEGPRWTRAVEDQSAPIPEEITSELGGSILSRLGTTILVWQNFAGPQVWETAQDSRARLARRARRGRVRDQKFEVFGTSNPELRTLDHAFLACLALRAARSMAADGLFQHPDGTRDRC